jgi:hypothetical protein
MTVRAAFVTLLTALAAIASQPASAQSLSVVAMSPLSFGDSYRRTTRTIRPADIDAARFEVFASAGRLLRLWLTVLPARATQPIPNGHGSPRVLDVDIDGHLCEISTDGGRSWQRFDNGGLSRDLRVPGEPASEGRRAQELRILVRVGATLVVGDDQRRGDYNGRVILSAMYIDGPSSVD